MKTSATELLGIDVPIVLAALGGVGGPQLSAAVANAGGLGMLPVWPLGLEETRTAIRETRALTTRPFAVNLNMEFPQEERLEVCLEEDVRVISFFWQDPTSLIPRAKEAGATVLYTVGSARDAVKAVDAGVDIIVAQGWEAGGHVRGEVATMALVPAVVDAVGDRVPVIAAGGIADGRGLAAALALGASAAWIGTRFLASEEVMAHPEYQRLLLEAAEDDTAHMHDLFDIGWPDAPHRTLRNSTVEAWRAAGSPSPGARPGEGEIVAETPAKGSIARYTCHSPTATATGDIEAMSLWAGQSVGITRHIQPAAAIVDEIVTDAARILGRLGGSA